MIARLIKPASVNQLILWLGAAAVITLIYGTIHLSVQQSLRLSANDPQIEMAEETADALAVGQTPNSLAGQPVDIGSSLTPFVMIYGRDGKLAASGASLNGSQPELPAGVLSQAVNRSRYQVTWQPAPGVRIAAVVKAVSNGEYVVAGRSLREVERRENQNLIIVALAWAASLVILTVTMWLKQLAAR